MVIKEYMLPAIKMYIQIFGTSSATHTQACIRTHMVPLVLGYIDN